MMQKNKYPKMKIGIGLLMGFVVGLVFQSIPLGIAVGFIFALSLPAEPTDEEQSAAST